MLNKKVSIVVPVYNMEKYLDRCVQSLLMQTYTNIEIILVNDGSTDKTASICKNYADERIVYIEKENAGVSAARNDGIDNSTGEYITFVDPDDYVSTCYIERLMSYTDRADIVSCCCKVLKKEGEVKNSFYNFYRDNEGHIDKKRALIQIIFAEYYRDSDEYTDLGVTWGKLYSSKLIRENKIYYDISLRRHQDNIFNLYAFQHANNIYYFDEPLYSYQYDNIDNYFKKYIPDAMEIYGGVAEKVFEFLHKYKYDLDEDYLVSTFLRINRCFNFIFYNYFLHPNYNLGFRKTYIISKKIVETEVLAYFFKYYSHKKIENSFANNLLRYLLKYRMNCLFTMLILFKRKINKKKG